jgi:hypothetical protein
MPLKVIGAGQRRTGTASLREGLQLLGLKTHHAFDFTGPEGERWLEGLELTNAVLDGKQVDFEKYFQGYDAAVDTIDSGLEARTSFGSISDGKASLNLTSLPLESSPRSASCRKPQRQDHPHGPRQHGRLVEILFYPSSVGRL